MYICVSVCVPMYVFVCVCVCVCLCVCVSNAVQFLADCSGAEGPGAHLQQQESILVEPILPRGLSVLHSL